MHLNQLSSDILKLNFDPTSIFQGEQHKDLVPKFVALDADLDLAQGILDTELNDPQAEQRKFAEELAKLRIIDADFADNASKGKFVDIFSLSNHVKESTDSEFKNHLQESGYTDLTHFEFKAISNIASQVVESLLETLDHLIFLSKEDSILKKPAVGLIPKLTKVLSLIFKDLQEATKTRILKQLGCKSLTDMEMGNSIYPDISAILTGRGSKLARQLALS